MRINDPDSFVSLSILLQPTSSFRLVLGGGLTDCSHCYCALLRGSRAKRRQRTIQSLCEGKKNNAVTVNEIAVAKGARHEAGKCSRGEVRPGG